MVTATPPSGSSRTSVNRSSSVFVFRGSITAFTLSRLNAMLCISGESECPIGLPATPKIRVAWSSWSSRYRSTMVRAVTCPGAVSAPSSGEAKVNAPPARGPSTRLTRPSSPMAMPTTCDASDRSSIIFSTARLSDSVRAVDTTFTKSGSKASIRFAACSRPLVREKSW